jgi:hypothetical protein
VTQVVGVAAVAVLGDPVEAGEAGVEHALADIARHFLRANQHALDLGVVDRGKYDACVDVDVESGAREQLNRRILERALGKTQLQLHGIVIPSARRLKQVRSPVWHTLPSPSAPA